MIDLLIKAVEKGNSKFLEKLLADGADPNSVIDENGNTILMLAIQLGKVEIVKVLLAHGVDPKITNNNGYNALTFMAHISSGDITSKERKIFSLLAQKFNIAQIVDRDGSNFYDILVHAGLNQKNKSYKRKARKELKSLLKLDPAYAAYKIDDALVDDVINLGLQKTLLRLLCSDSKDAGLHASFDVAAFFLETAQIISQNQSNRTEFNAKLFCKILQQITENKDIATPSGKKLQILKSSLDHHASFFVIELDQNNKPLALYYVDGNCLFKKETAEVGFAATRFELKLELQSLPVLLEKLYNITSSQTQKTRKEISQLVNPESAQHLVKTKAQARNNCMTKSVKCLTELLGIIAHGQEASPQWHLQCKEFKHSLIAYSQKSVTEILQRRGGTLAQEAKNILAETRAHQERKPSTSITAQTKATLQIPTIREVEV